MSMCVPYSIGSLSRPPPTPRPTVWEVQILNPYRVEKSHLKKHSEVHFFYLVRFLVAADAPIGEHAPYFVMGISLRLSHSHSKTPGGAHQLIKHTCSV